MSEKILKIFYINNKFIFFDPEDGYTYKEGKKGYRKWFKVRDLSNIKKSIEGELV